MTNQTDHAPAGRGEGRPADCRLTLRRGGATRHVFISAGRQIGLGAAAALLLGWTAFSSASLIIATLERDALALQVAQLEAEAADELAALRATQDARAMAFAAAAEARERALIAERDGWAAEAASVRGRLGALAQELTERQGRLMNALESEAELAVALDSLRAKLRDAVADRDAADLRSATLAQELGDLRGRAAAANSAEAEWTASLSAVTHALEQVSRERDAADATRRTLTDELVSLQARSARAGQARERLYAQLEDAVQAGLGGLERSLSATGLDVNRLVDGLRQDYSGAGGPFVPVFGPDAEDAPQFASADAARVTALLGGLERASLLQIAAAKLPMAHPLRAAHRYTSGFGVRRDPKNGRTRMHAGADFAGPAGTPIFATGDGVVTFAGWQSGYGRVIKIRHAFGFETIFAHLNATRVTVGDRVARDDRIGDMGRTGRTTGTHLHYEVRLNGKPVNPMKYIEAARNVL